MSEHPEHVHIHEVIDIDEDIEENGTDSSDEPTPIGDAAAAAVDLNPDGAPAPPDATHSDHLAAQTDNGPTAEDPPQDNVPQDPIDEAGQHVPDPTPAPPADPAPAADPSPTTSPSSTDPATPDPTSSAPDAASPSSAAPDGGTPAASDPASTP